MTNVLSYNVTSLVSRTKRAEVNDTINKVKVEVILLQETHLSDKHSLFLSEMRVKR